MANILKHITPGKAAQTALDIVQQEREEGQLGLLTQFNSLNVSMGKYFRFNIVNLLAGLSGHAKSYLLNILTNNFLDYKKDGLNHSITYIPIVLHFCFEMSAYNEILRKVAGDLGISYGYLLSSQYDKDSKSYNKLTDDELDKVKACLDHYKNDSILFFENSGNVKLIYNTVEHYYNYYNNLPNAISGKVVYKFIVNIDHTLLIETLDERSTLDLMANVGKIAISIRKRFGAMVNLLGQLNNNIEDPKRITNPALHYPMKSDIYAQGQLYNACDNVFTTHQPRLLQISLYGAQKLPTKGLIHLLKLKARHGSVGSIWLMNDLNEGRIKETSVQELKKPKEDEKDLTEYE